MKKTLDINKLEAINIVAFYNQMPEEVAAELGIKIRWVLKKVVAKILPDAKEFEEFRDKEIKNLQERFFTDEKSEEGFQTKVDENGNPILDESGTEVTEPIRKIKEEYMNEYQEAVADLNHKLEEILTERCTYQFDGVNMDEFVASLPDDTKIDFHTLEMLEAVVGTEGDE